MKHSLPSPKPPPRPPFIAKPIPRTGQRGLESDAEIKILFAGIIERLYAPTKKRKIQ